ncbi:MAG: potassium-transporting ATPase subunit KdpC [Thermodesulforhabdaceae bacterium]
MKEIWKIFGIYLTLFFITGLVYPIVVTEVAQFLFKEKAKGSIVYKDDKPAGSKLIAQPFVSENLFWGRPSSSNFDTLSSGGSNLGPTNPELSRQVLERIKALRESGVHGLIPSYLVYTSGSGLDPHLPPEAVYLQVERVSRTTGIPPEEIKRLIDRHTEGRSFGIMGQETVNILELNLELLDLMEKHGKGIRR